MVKTINILGVTGSIGQSAVDVITANPGHFRVNLVTAHSNEAQLEAAAQRLGARRAILTGKDSMDEALQEKVDITLCAITGMAGLSSMMQAIESSRAVAIANKEPLVAAGPQVMAAAEKYGTQLLPVDSEHNAVFQVFNAARRGEIKKIILTASGGPFRTWPRAQTERATVAQALAHPNWAMGKKISIDSATMMNKALEIIEAHYLFSMPPGQIEVLIHPESVVHSMVEYIDGSVLAQMGASDMRTPLSNVLAWPERLSTPGQVLDFSKFGALHFEAPDYEKFPVLKLAYQCLERGQAACVAFNAANEVAVEAFLDNRIGFLDIIDCIDHILQSIEGRSFACIDDVLDYDQTVRVILKARIEETTQKAVNAS